MLVERCGSSQTRLGLQVLTRVASPGIFHRICARVDRMYTVSAGMLLRLTFVVQTVVTFLLRSEGSEVQQDRLAGQFTQRCSLTEIGSVTLVTCR